MKVPFHARSLAFRLAFAVCAVLAGCTSESSSRKLGIAGEQLTGPGINLFAAGDIADCRKTPAKFSGAAKTADLVQAGLRDDSLAVVLTLGDNSYPVGALPEFTDCYDPTWGQFKARTYPVPGNHEYYSPQASGYYRYFGSRAGPERKGYYSFDLGQWHVISLNSNLRGEQYQAQLAWLRLDLARNASLCTLAYWHHPLFSSGWHGDNPGMAELWDVLQQAGVELALTSHDHVYERFGPQDSRGRRDAKGIRQFVVGTGGAQLTPFAIQRAGNSEVSDNSTLGVLQLTLKDNGYRWNFLPVENSGFTDQGAALCH